MSQIIKNKKAYDSGDVDVFVNGIPTNVVEISYDKEQEHQLNHTLKNDASSWSQGKKSLSGTMTLMMEDAVIIEDSANGDLLSIKPFTINVSYVNEFNKIVNDSIIAKFMKQGREVTGDMGLQKQYDLFIMDIKFNKA